MLQETQRALSQTTKDVDLLRKTTNDQEQRLASLSSDLKSVKQEYDALQAKYSGLSNDVSVLFEHLGNILNFMLFGVPAENIC